MTNQDFIEQTARRLGCDRARAEQIVRAVLATVRDGLSDAEARTVGGHLPDGLATMWPERPENAHPELVETGGRGFVGVLRERSGMATDNDAGRAASAVFATMIDAIGMRDGRERGAWDALSHLPPELKSVWMRIFRVANFPVARLVSDR